LPLEYDSFYDFSNPLYLQQGDLFPNVPLVSLPPGKELILLRVPGSRARLRGLPGEAIEAVRERATDAFGDDEPEHIVALAQRAMGILITQTCDIEDTEQQNWLVSPAYSIDGSSVDRKTLFANKYSNLFLLPRHPNGYFEDSYIDLSDMRPVRRGSVGLPDRVASLSKATQNELAEKLARSLSRRWGFGPGEVVRVSGKYRCNSCNNYFGVGNPERDFAAGERFPGCPDCAEVHKTAAWYLLVQHRRS